MLIHIHIRIRICMSGISLYIYTQVGTAVEERLADVLDENMSLTKLGLIVRNDRPRRRCAPSTAFPPAPI